jgi:hypothetical protein
MGGDDTYLLIKYFLAGFVYSLILAMVNNKFLQARMRSLRRISKKNIPRAATLLRAG